MALDPHGILALATAVIYLPLLFFSIRIALKYHKRAWTYLPIFALIRVLGGALLVAAELIRPAVTGLYIGGYALEASGLSPLLLCTLGLLHLITETPDGQAKHGLMFRVLQLIGITGLVLTIIGVSSTSSSSQSSAETMRRAGIIIFAALYIILVGITASLWLRAHHLMKFRKQLLARVSFALPFLAVRTLYGVLSTFSSTSFVTTGSTPIDSGDSLAKFNMFTGEWQIFLAMDLIMECVIAFLYTHAGMTLRLNEDYKLQESDEYPLYHHRY